MKKGKIFRIVVSLFTLVLSGCASSANNDVPYNGHVHNLRIKHDFDSHNIICEECGYVPNDKYEDPKYFTDDSFKLLDIFYTTMEKYQTGYHHSFWERENEPGIRECEICHAKFNYEYVHNEQKHWYKITDLETSEVLENDIMLCDPQVHDFEIYEWNDFATFDEPAYKKERCIICGYEKETITEGIKEHSYSTDWTYDEKGHWHECTDWGYSELKKDYAEHTIIDTHEYKEGDLHGGLIHHECECGYKSDVEYEMSPSEEETMKYLDYKVYGYNGDCVIHTNQLADIELPTKLVYPEYLTDEDGKLRPVKYIYATSGLQYWSAGDYVQEIYLPSTFSGFSNSVIYPYFENFRGLKSITVDEDNPNFTAIGGNLFTKDNKKLICFPQNRAAPGGLFLDGNIYSEIGDYAFYKNRYIDQVMIKDNPIKLGSNLFDGALNDIVFNISFKTYQQYFALKKSLNDYETHLYNAGNKFDEENELKDITLSDSLMEIPSNAFKKCTSLERIYIPKSISTIANNSFTGCTSLNRIQYEGTQAQWNTLAGSNFDYASAQYVDCSDGTIVL